ncbi:MAG: hypothetical protein ACXWBN_01390 [Acidimicrobiales bacterium]
MNSAKARRRVATAAAVVAWVLLTSCSPTLGGPDNRFGNDPTRGASQPGFWAAINGPYSAHADGDPYATKCAAGSSSATSCDSGGANPDYDATGYLYSISVPKQAVGNAVTVAIFDPTDGPNPATGEPAFVRSPFATSFQLFNATGSGQAIDISPSNGMNQLGRCAIGPGYRVFAAGSTESAGAWYTLCTFTPTVDGIYPLRVRSSGIPGVVDAGDGSNNFSVRATTSAPVQPIVQAIGSASIRVDASGTAGVSRSYLTQLASAAAGHVVLVDLFDPGDGLAGTEPFTIQVMAPPATGSPGVVPAPGTPVACDYNATKSYVIGPSTPVHSSTCTVTTQPANGGTPIYDNGWLRLRIVVPATYTCSTNCWWSIAESFGSGTVTDRLVWRLTVSDSVVPAS